MTQAFDPIVCQAIGVLRTRFTEVEGMPIQTAAAAAETGELEVFPAFEAGLADLAEFEYLILLTHFHRIAQERLQVVPFLDSQPRGVFATRAPARPNRIGLSIVRLDEMRGRMLRISGIDMLDGTPVLDIKPYVPRFDVRETDRVGWFAQRLDQLPHVRADGRMK